MQNNLSVQGNVFDKITEYVIKPIASLWGGTPDEYTIKAYIEELGKFSPDVLQKAMRGLRNASAKKPSLAAIIAACYDAKGTQISGPEARKYSDDRLPQAKVDEVMRGFVGQRAIREGWWHELYEHLIFTPHASTYITDDIIEDLLKKYNRAYPDSRVEQNVAESPAGMRESLEKIWEKMQERRRGAAEYYGIEDTAHYVGI